MADWFVLRLTDPDLAVKTMRRLNVPYAYPEVRVRRPRRPDLVEPMLRGYALTTFDPDEPVQLTFWREGATYQRPVHWSALGDLPGVGRVFHDGRRPLPVLGMSDALRRALGEDLGPQTEPDVDASRYAVGDVLRIADGPLRSFMARIESAVHGVYRAQVEIFGRSCPAEFTEDQLEVA